MKAACDSECILEASSIMGLVGCRTVCHDGDRGMLTLDKKGFAKTSSNIKLNPQENSSPITLVIQMEDGSLSIFDPSVNNGKIVARNGFFYIEEDIDSAEIDRDYLFIENSPDYVLGGNRKIEFGKPVVVAKSYPLSAIQDEL